VKPVGEACQFSNFFQGLGGEQEEMTRRFQSLVQDITGRGKTEVFVEFSLKRANAHVAQVRELRNLWRSSQIEANAFDSRL